VIVVFAYIITPLAASAQIVEPDVKRWSEEQCIWLHREALDECKMTDPQQECSGKLADQGSMSTIRRLNALDAFWTVRDREEFEGICFKVCKEAIQEGILLQGSESRETDVAAGLPRSVPYHRFSNFFRFSGIIAIYLYLRPCGLAPVLLRLALHRRRCRVFEFEPVPGAAADIRRAQALRPAFAA
jgi:hypothetical protein